MHTQLFFLSLSQKNKRTPSHRDTNTPLWWVKRYHQTPRDSQRYEMYNQQTVEIKQENTCLAQRCGHCKYFCVSCCDGHRVKIHGWSCRVFGDFDASKDLILQCRHSDVINDGSRPRLPSSPSATYLHLNDLYWKILKLKCAMWNSFSYPSPNIPIPTCKNK